MAEPEAPRVKRLAPDARQPGGRRGRPEPVLALAEERMAAHAGLHPDLVAFAGHERHRHERSRLELLQHDVVSHGLLATRVGGVGLPLSQLRGVPRQLIAPRTARRPDDAFDDRLVEAQGRAPLELLFERVAGLGGPGEEHQPARVAIDPMHHVERRARVVPEVMPDEVEQRDLCPASPGEGLDNHARRFVGGDEAGVLGHDAKEVAAGVSVPVRGAGRARAVHPERDAQARHQAVRRLVRSGSPAVEVDLAPLEPRRGTAARARAGVACQPEVEPHPGGINGDDPLLHPVVSW